MPGLNTKTICDLGLDQKAIERNAKHEFPTLLAGTAYAYSETHGLTAYCLQEGESSPSWTPQRTWAGDPPNQVFF